MTTKDCQSDFCCTSSNSTACPVSRPSCEADQTCAASATSALDAISPSSPPSIERAGQLDTGLVVIPRVVRPVRRINQIPEDILNDPLLHASCQALPSRYRLEVPKCVWQIRKHSAKRVALQFPEGLTMFACLLSDIFKEHGGCETVIMADVTYGACCVDDYRAKELGCDMLIHYGHSCLIPVTQTQIPCVYVFVEIEIDVEHIREHIRQNASAFTTDGSMRPRLAVVSTIQFVAAVHALRATPDLPVDIFVPQSKPLSPGEILGCTAPRLPAGVDQLLYIGDGRFHLEAMMIANPQIGKVFKYDPYAHVMTTEGYDHAAMQCTRQSAIAQASKAKLYGLILGTLGRQGSTAVLDELQACLRGHGLRFIVLLMAEIRPDQLDAYPDVDAWIQVACPRLSIDWGTAFSKPILSPYEASVMLGRIAWQPVYPMDYYARESLGPWTVYSASAGRPASQGVDR